MNSMSIKIWEEQAKKQLNGREVVLSLSGGKDSTAMALWFAQSNISHRRVFIDTGWEHPATKEYLLEYLQPKIGPIEVLHSPEGGMKNLIRTMKLFPKKSRRFCTGKIKMLPMRIYLEEQPYELVNAVGVRADESKKRSTYGEWEYSSALQADVWRPILSWSLQQVIDIHQQFEVRPNPLYLMGSKRVGCWPCIFSSKAEVRLLAEEDPDRIQEIYEFEKEINTLRRSENIEAKLVSWFSVGGRALPIKDAVRWAFGKGNKEILLANDREVGCMRWGMCSSVHPLQEHNESLKQ